SVPTEEEDTDVRRTSMRRLRLTALVAALALILAACGGDGASTTTAGADTTPTTEGATEPTAPATTGGETTETTGGEAPEGDPIVFASSLPLTGEFSITGAKHRDGYQFCVDEINARGGILGRPVELLVE